MEILKYTDDNNSLLSSIYSLPGSPVQTKTDGAGRGPALSHSRPHARARTGRTRRARGIRSLRRLQRCGGSWGGLTYLVLVPRVSMILSICSGPRAKRHVGRSAGTHTNQ